MLIHKDLNNLPQFKNAVITIGSFDGVHIGHQKILTRIKRLAENVEGESIVITFYPHPRKIIFPKDNTLRLLNTIEEKLNLFEALEIDHVVIIPFSIEFSQQLPQEYLEKFIVGKFQPSKIVIGYDHKFGLNRGGDINLLKSCATKYKYEVVEIKKQEIEDITVSSTKIRTALQSGNIREANMFLGHPYSLSGTVTRGDNIGTELGFPTANILVKEREKLIPQQGIYAVNVKIDNEDKHGMLYIGSRPTIKENTVVTIEVNIFDFNKDIYDLDIKVELLEYIRDDKKYDNLTQLKEQLHIDRKNVLKILGVSENYTIPKDISIAILNYNGQEFLESYLPSVIEACPDNGKVVVIDNASADDSLEFLEEWFPEVEIIALSKNHGFTQGYNLGMKRIESPYTLILNSDVLLHPDCINVLFKAIEERPDIGVIQPKILSLEEKSKFEYAGAAGGKIDRWGYPYCRGRIFNHIEEDHNQYKNEEIHWASGAAMIVRTALFKDLGGFDPEYFAHMEEIDFCIRVRKAGYKIYYEGAAIVYHLGGGTLNYGSPRKVYLNFKNNLTTLLKNESKVTLIWLIPLRFILDGIAGIKFLFEGQLKAFLSIIKAHLTIYSNIASIIRRRKYFNALVDKFKIGPSNYKHDKYILLNEHYIKGKKKFSDF